MSTNGRARWKQRYYEVEQILGSRVATAENVAEAECGSIKWLGWGVKHNKWLPASWVNCPRMISEYNRGVAARQKEKDRKREAAAKELAKRRERAAKERERQQAERQKQRDALKKQKALEKELEEESSEEEAEKFWSVRFDDRASEILMHCYQDTCSDSDFNHDDDAVATADIWPLLDAHGATNATSSFTRDVKLSGLSARQAEAAIAAAALTSVDDQCAEMQPNKRAERRFAGARVSGRKSIAEVKLVKTGGLVPTLPAVQAQVDQARINLFAEPQENASESVYPRSSYPPTYMPLRVHKPKPSLSTRDQVLRILQRSGESRHMLAARFHRTGVCYSRRGLTAEQSALVAAQVTTFYNSCITAVRALGLQSVLEETGFTDFKQRQRGRYDLAIPALLDEKEFPYLNRDAPWLPLVRTILGDDCKFIHAGCMLSLPGSESQPFHSDGPHLHKNYLPCHALNVFVPLSDLRLANGPTEFIPESHRFYDIDRKPVQFELNAGQVLLFDYRVKHRGVENRSDRPRPMLYFTYAKPFYSDTANFSSKRYREMPPLLQQLADATAHARARAGASPTDQADAQPFDPLRAIMNGVDSAQAAAQTMAAIRASRAQQRQLKRQQAHEESDDESDQAHKRSKQ